MARRKTAGESDAPIVIKKYANRRLYNTATSSYVTLETLCQMVKDGAEFTVHDAKTGEDITRSVLTQIIVEEESKGQNLLPIGFLRQLISFYGDSLQGMVPRYLEQSMRAFIHNQEQMRHAMSSAFGGMFPFNPMEEMGKQNIAMMERAMEMFGGPEEAGAEKANREPPAPGVPGRDRLDLLQEQVEALQRQIAEMSGRK